jgi:hypothetical protein
MELQMNRAATAATGLSVAERTKCGCFAIFGCIIFSLPAWLMLMAMLDPKYAFELELPGSGAKSLQINSTQWQLMRARHGTASLARITGGMLTGVDLLPNITVGLSIGTQPNSTLGDVFKLPNITINFGLLHKDFKWAVIKSHFVIWLSTVSYLAMTAPYIFVAMNMLSRMFCKCGCVPLASQIPFVKFGTVLVAGFISMPIVMFAYTQLPTSQCKTLYTTHYNEASGSLQEMGFKTGWCSPTYGESSVYWDVSKGMVAVEIVGAVVMAAYCCCFKKQRQATLDQTPLNVA